MSKLNDLRDPASVAQPIDPGRSALWNEILVALGPDVPPNDAGYRIANRIEALVEKYVAVP